MQGTTRISRGTGHDDSLAGRRGAKTPSRPATLRHSRCDVRASCVLRQPVLPELFDARRGAGTRSTSNPCGTTWVSDASASFTGPKAALTEATPVGTVAAWPPEDCPSIRPLLGSWTGAAERSGRLGRVARGQDGVGDRRQLAVGRPRPDDGAAGVAHGRWQQFGRIVVVLHNAASRTQRQWMRLTCGGSRPRWPGLRGRGAESPASTMSRSRSWSPPTATRAFRAGSACTTRAGSAQPTFRRPCVRPRTSPARSVVDAAAWSPYPRRACVLLCAAVQQRVDDRRRAASRGRADRRATRVLSMRDVSATSRWWPHADRVDLGSLAGRPAWPPRVGRAPARTRGRAASSMPSSTCPRQRARRRDRRRRSPGSRRRCGRPRPAERADHRAAAALLEDHPRSRLVAPRRRPTRHSVRPAARRASD